MPLSFMCLRLSDFLPTMCRTSILEAHPDQWVDQDRISSLFLGRGLLQTLHTAETSGTVATNQIAPSVGVGNRTAQVPGNHKGHPRHTFVPEMSRGPLFQRNAPGLPPPGAISSQTINNSVTADTQFLWNATAGQSQASTSIYPPGLHEKRSQATVTNSNTVHVMFSRARGNVLGQSSSAIDVSTWTLDTSQGYPGMGSWVAQFIPNSPVPPANTGTPSMQQYHTPFAASASDKELPLNLNSSVHQVLPQRHPVALPVYSPAPYPVFLNPGVGNRFLPVAVEGMTVLPVYLSVPPPRPLPVATTSRQGVATCSSSVGVGSRFTARGHVSTSANVILPVASQSVSASQGTSRYRQQQSTVHVQLASERVAGTTTNPQTDVGLACLQMSTILKQALRDKRLSGDYGFLVEQYRSALEQEPNNTVSVTDEKSLIHFLKITESQLRANALALEKKCLTFQALTEKYQEDILKEGEKYRQAMRKKTVAEQNISAIEEKIKGRWKQRSFKVIEGEIKELEAKLETLKNEKDTLQGKWLNYEKNLPRTPLENQPPS